jgi:hypothetical protein
MSPSVQTPVLSPPQKRIFLKNKINPKSNENAF